MAIRCVAEILAFRFDVLIIGLPFRGGLRKVVNLEIFGKILVGKFRATVSNFFYRTDEALLMEIFGCYLKSVL